MTDVEARREARRKRILENSEIRLQRITGVEQRNGSYELEGYNGLHDGSETSIKTSSDSNFSIQSNNGAESHASINKHRHLTSLNEDVTIVRKTSVIIQHRISIIILLAFLMNVLLCLFENPSSMFLNKIFVPLLCFEIIVLSQPQEDTHNVQFNFLLLLQNQSRMGFGHFLKFFSVFKTLVSDLLIYFFVFMCILFLKMYFLQLVYWNI